MNSLRAYLQQAQQDRDAIGHFDISDLVALKAVFVAAQDAVKQVAASRLMLFNDIRHVAGAGR